MLLALVIKYVWLILEATVVSNAAQKPGLHYTNTFGVIEQLNYNYRHPAKSAAAT